MRYSKNIQATKVMEERYRLSISPGGTQHMHTHGGKSDIFYQNIAERDILGPNKLNL